MTVFIRMNSVTSTESSCRIRLLNLLKGTARDAVRQVPFMQEMNQEIMKVTDLHGNFRVTIDGTEIGRWDGDC